MKPCLKTNQQQKSHTHTPQNIQYVTALSIVVFPSVELKHRDIKCLFQAVNISYPKAEIKFNKHYEVPLHKPVGALGHSVTRMSKCRVTASSKAGQTLIWTNLATWIHSAENELPQCSKQYYQHLERNEAHVPPAIGINSCVRQRSPSAWHTLTHRRKGRQCE